MDLHARNSDCKPTPRRRDAVRCGACGRSVARRSHHQRFCSDRCRQDAARRKAADALKKSPRYPYSGRVTSDAKNLSNNSSLQRPKTGSSLFANAPLDLVGGGSWRWPNTAYPDGKTLANILHREIGGRRIEVTA